MTESAGLEESSESEPPSEPPLEPPLLFKFDTRLRFNFLPLRGFLSNTASRPTLRVPLPSSKPAFLGAATILLSFAGLLSYVSNASAQSNCGGNRSPYRPDLTSPSNGDTVSGNPTLRWTAGSDPEGQPLQYRVVIRSGQGNGRDSGWISSTTWSPSPSLPPGGYNWVVNNRDSCGAESGHTPDWNFTVVGTVPAPTSTPAPPPTSSPSSSAPQGPSISELSFDPSSGANSGQTLRVHIKVGSSNPGAVRTTVPCGSIQHFEHTVPEYDTNWNTSGCGGGSQTVRVCARHVEDRDWRNPGCLERTYSLGAPPPQAPTADFRADASTIDPGSCTTLRWSTNNATRVDSGRAFPGCYYFEQVRSQVRAPLSLKHERAR